MKKLITILATTVALTIAAHATEGDAKKDAGESTAPKKQSPLTAEQKASRKELITKYDANKNGYLDKEEKSKMTSEDLEKWNGFSASKTKAHDGEKKDGDKKADKKP